ncbi:MAG: glycosyltransferase family 4 protein [Planctomycetota bacterium]
MNRSYRPDAEATGQLLTELSEDLAANFPDQAAGGGAGGWRVTVICGLPNSNPDGEPAPFGRSEHRGVTVSRVRHSRVAGDSKTSLRLRAIDFFTFLTAAAWRGLFHRRVDVVVSETDPFPIVVVGRILAMLHRAKFVLYAQDVNPDLGLTLNLIPDNVIVRSVQRAMYWATRRADAIVALSTDMRETFLNLGVPEERIAVLPNWADTDLIRPFRERNEVREAWNLGEPGAADAKFVVMHSGNMGRTQRLGIVLRAADRLKHDPRIQFLLVGGGADATPLKKRAREMALQNLRFVPYQPKSKLGKSLSAADLHLVCTDARVIPYLMPCKLYGVLAAGVPVICVAPAESEIGRTVSGFDERKARGEPVGDQANSETRCGWTVDSGDDDSLAAAIAHAASLPRDVLHAMGDAGRRQAERRFSRAAVTPRFSAVLKAVLAGDSPADAARATARSADS